MTRSVEELRRESERNRAQLAATVDRLRERITNTAEDIRYKVSPESIRSEVSEFISHKTQSWVSALKQQAMENPMQAIAAGAAVAVPAMRLMRGFPLPLLMIGAGLALSSKTVRARAAEAAAPVIEKAEGMMGDAAERAQSLGRNTADAFTSAGSQAAGVASEARDAASEFTGNLKDRAGQAADNMGNNFSAGMDAASEFTRDTLERARSKASNAAAAVPPAASQVIRDNAALIGGLGIVMGAIIAASLPDTKAEAAVMGKASDGVKRAAGEAAQSGFEAAKDAVLSAADAAAKSVADADLSKHASRMTQGMADTFKEVVDDVVSTAFDPSRNPHT
jgi:hypothetical protein